LDVEVSRKVATESEVKLEIGFAAWNAEPRGVGNSRNREMSFNDYRSIHLASAAIGYMFGVRIGGDKLRALLRRGADNVI
jgi:hypothetical protein